MQFPLDLTSNNVTKLINGHPIQLRKEQLMGNKHYLVVHPATHTRLSKAKAAGKGARLSLTPQELTASGEGFMDILRGIKKGATWIKQNVIDKPFYQQTVKPVVRQAVEGVISSLPLPAPVKGVAEAGVQKLGEVTGAFGLEGLQSNPLVMSQPKKKRVTAKPRAKRASKPKAKAVGGSFLVN
jgi:hypothetical protein